MKVFTKTDVGMTRSMNQDSLLVSDNNRNGLNLYILADGMGGYKGGEIASKVAITAVSKYIIEKFDEIPKDKQSILNLVEDSIEFANSAIYEESEQDEELQDMGTTLEVVLIYKNKVYIGHIGDSRIYRVRKNKMKKITTDHSYVEKLIQDGDITREEAYNHPKKNLLIKALGTDEEACPDMIYTVLNKNDVIVICSDGLTNMLREEEILEVVKEPNENCADVLVEEANLAGGLDNITVIVIDNR
ncbi:MAG: Stp1/IreP family PP2C-type Ser/Thr phosphatase [Coprobacillus sp.]|jgi:serine/threonine protein phosphatase PrpC|nr:Stp1/IreP family PP2C-type Ser/Thr phosphatase [Coprobacillus sp.]